MSEKASISSEVTPAAPAAVRDTLFTQELLQQDIDKESLQRLPIQRKLSIGAVDDPLEQEADAVADQVMRMPEKPFLQRQCTHCEEEEKQHIQAKPLASRITPFIQRNSEREALASESVTNQINATKGGGSSLPETTKSFMENRFGADLSEVKIHTGGEAIQMNRELNAKAFTIGKDIYFNTGQYEPGTFSGKRLLAHELTHVVQQGNNPTIQRAFYNVGSVTVNVDFVGLYAVQDANLVSEIERRFVSYTSATDASVIHATLSALPPDKQRWVLYALDLLMDNTTAAHARLNRIVAVQRLIAYAPNSFASFNAAGLGFAAENEALRASGWFEVALTSGFTAPNSTDSAAINTILNPPVLIAPGHSTAVLDVVNFHARMDPAIRHLLNNRDPNNRKSVGTRSLPELKVIADEIMVEARSFFSPYADSSRTTVFGLHPAFLISTNIFSTNAISYSSSDHMGYLRNRGGLVGRNTDASEPMFSDTNIFQDVNYDGSDALHRAQFNILINNLLLDPTVTAIVNRLLQNTGQQSGSGASTTIGLSTEFDSSKMTDCKARWSIINTLCHEVLHSLAHPDFETTSGSRTKCLPV